MIKTCSIMILIIPCICRHDLRLLSFQVLNMERNIIENISDETFSGLFRLHTLVLSDNRVKLLTHLTLSGLVNLTHLSLDHNQIFRIDKDALQNSTKLKDIHLDVNYLKDVPLVLQRLPNLLTLDLSGNKILDLGDTAFENLHHLTVLNLAKNEIEFVSKEVFKSLGRLRVLNLSSNKIKKIEKGAFDANKNLKAIRVDDNYLISAHNLFFNLTDLRWLNLSQNHLETFDYYFVPPGLQFLDLRSNRINELGNFYKNGSKINLLILDASFNRLRDISSSSIPDSIETIFLNGNQISQIQPYTFFTKKNLSRVDLFSNKIMHLNQNALRLSVLDPAKPRPEFYIGENPLECDCSLHWLQKINAQDEIRQTPRVVDLAAITCRLLNSRGQTFLPLLEVKKHQFLCEYDSHCPLLCHCCEFDACDCEMSCPQNCTCYHDQSWAANVVDCSNSNYRAVPDRLPMDASEVYLDGNNIDSISSHTFIGRKNLQVLFLNHSNINTVLNRTFSGLKQLQILYLNNNNLKVLKGFEFESLTFLHELYVHDNQITSIHNATFNGLKSLRILRIDGNLLHVMSFNQLRDTLTSVRIGRNPWSCECTFLGKMRDWLHNMLANEKISPIVTDQLYCLQNGTHDSEGQEIASNQSTICERPYSERAPSRSSEMHYLVPAITLGAVTLFISAFLLIFCNRNKIRVYIYAKHGIRLFHKSDLIEDSSKVFDAFVSYSSKDEVFVTQILAPELERGSPAYKLCLHYRDFSMGAYVTDSILSAVESSKRTLLILSENFINSEWRRYEFRSAHHEVLRDRRRRLIVILLGEVSPGDLDPDLRLYLKTNTWLRWGDTNFWHKLKFALPDAKPPSINHQVRVIQQQVQEQEVPHESQDIQLQLQSSSLPQHYQNTLSSTYEYAEEPNRTSTQSSNSSSRTTGDTHHYHRPHHHQSVRLHHHHHHHLHHHSNNISNAAATPS